MACAVFFLYLTGSTYWAIVQDTVRGAHVGGVGGFMHAIANCAGIIGPTVTGFIVQYTGAFTSAFVLAGALAIVGVLAVIVFVRPIPHEVAGGGTRWRSRPEPTRSASRPARVNKTKEEWTDGTDLALVRPGRRGQARRRAAGRGDRHRHRAAPRPLRRRLDRGGDRAAARR